MGKVFCFFSLLILYFWHFECTLKTVKTDISKYTYHIPLYMFTFSIIYYSRVGFMLGFKTIAIIISENIWICVSGQFSASFATLVWFCHWNAGKWMIWYYKNPVIPFEINRGYPPYVWEPLDEPKYCVSFQLLIRTFIKKKKKKRSDL